jgi:hypothetical protein
VQPSLPTSLAETLEIVGRASHDARDPWWVIGSAAMALHGADVEAGDVDLLTSLSDARALCGAMDGVRVVRPPSDRFRSAMLVEILGAPLRIEIMAGFEVRAEGRWTTVAPLTRRQVIWNAHSLFVPDVIELAALCRTFGRPKDLARARMLDALVAGAPDDNATFNSPAR